MNTTTPSSNENEESQNKTTPNNPSLENIHTQINSVLSKNENKLTLIDHIFFVPAFIIICFTIFVTVVIKHCFCMVINSLTYCFTKLLSWICNLF